MESIDESVSTDPCDYFMQEYSLRAKALGYNLSIGVSEGIPDKGIKSKLIVIADFYLSSSEQEINRQKLRSLFPKELVFRDDSMQVVLGYVTIPKHIRSYLNSNKNSTERFQ